MNTGRTAVVPPPAGMLPGLYRDTRKFIAISLFGCATPRHPAVPADLRPARLETLRELAAERGFLIGTAVRADLLRDDPRYRETVARQFNLITTASELKFGPVHPERDRYDFGPADEILAFAERHRMQVRGHNLLWHIQQPDWLLGTQWSRDELETVLWGPCTCRCRPLS